MAKLHGFARSMEPITDFDGSDEEVVLSQKPKYARQLSMMDEERPDPPAETKEGWPDSYDITVTVSTTSRLYEKYKWNEERIPRLETLIARFARMSAESTGEAVAGIYSLDGIRWICSTVWRNVSWVEFATWRCTRTRISAHSWTGKSRKLTMLGMTLATF